MVRIRVRVRARMGDEVTVDEETEGGVRQERLNRGSEGQKLSVGVTVKAGVGDRVAAEKDRAETRQ